jgi:hypothetical protein
VADRIRIEAPLDSAFLPAVRLVAGGIAEAADLAFDDMDDLQLAIERLLAEAGGEGHVSISFELADRSLRASVGPLGERGLAEALQIEARDGALTLRKILDTVVDSFGVEEATDGRIVVRLEKLRGAA